MQWIQMMDISHYRGSMCEMDEWKVCRDNGNGDGNVADRFKVYEMCFETSFSDGTEIIVYLLKNESTWAAA